MSACGASLWLALDFLDDIDPQPRNQWAWLDLVLGNDINFGSSISNREVRVKTLSDFEEPSTRGMWRLARGSGLHFVLHNQALLGLELCIPDADDEVLGRVVP